MAKNIMAEVAKLLGTKLNEEFMIKEVGVWKYKITEEGLLVNLQDRWVVDKWSDVFEKLITGECEIEKDC